MFSKTLSVPVLLKEIFLWNINEIEYIGFEPMMEIPITSLKLATLNHSVNIL